MYALKGFITHAAFADNTVGKVAKIGEISSEGLTFSREKGQYTNAAVPDLTLISFLSAKDGVLVPVANNIRDHVIGIADFIFDQTLGSGQEVYGDELLNDLIAIYAGKAEEFSCGAIITDGRYYVPEWVSWKCIEDATLGENEIRLWFVDDSFKEQYDESQIIVVPPIDNLDDFFKTGTEVEALLKAPSESDRWQRVQNAKDGYPETIVRSEPYDYHDPYNSSHKVPSNWGLLIYGPAGNNIDFINDALVEYILANSTHTREEWTRILPDIFKRTEFILMPLWDDYAIPNKQTQEGLYSSLTNIAQAVAKFKQTVSGYNGFQIDTYGSVMGYPYKGLSIMAVGGPDNRDAKFRLKDVFPDYLPVSSTSQDFNRMSQATRGFLAILTEMIIWAEIMTDHSSIPVNRGYTRAIRNGVLYIVKNYQNINYLVAAKKNFPVT